MTNGVNRIAFWFTSLSKHTVFTPGNQSINLFPAHEQINSVLKISLGVCQQTQESYSIGHRDFSHQLLYCKAQTLLSLNFDHILIHISCLSHINIKIFLSNVKGMGIRGNLSG